jgi:hypothetical protein
MNPVPTSSSTSQGPFVFYLGPFRFESEIEIPELRGSTGSGEKVVRILLGGVPSTIPGAIFDGVDCHVTATEYLLDIPGTARYYVCNGNEVRLEIMPSAPTANVSTYLLGSCFGALCHQNGMLPLHASAVEFGDRVTAFLGDSGAGKSTLAACLRRRGHRIVSDDICLLQDDSDGMRVVPVAGWLKLWSESLQYLGETAYEQNRVYSTDDKFRLFLADSRVAPGSELHRLERVVFLAKGTDSRAQPMLEAVSMLDGIAGLMRLTYAGYVPELAGQKSRVFRQCGRVLQHAKAWRLTVPWGLDRMEAVLDLLDTEIFNAAASGTDLPMG